MIQLLFKIGFLELRFLDILDIFLVALLLYNLYKLVRGSLAFNIFIGLLFVYLAWLVVQAMNMHLTAGILGQFIDVGVIALLIVFQPEIRRFLLLLGKGSILNKDNFWTRLMSKKWDLNGDHEELEGELIEAIQTLARTKTGAILVFPKTSKLQFFVSTGVTLNAQINAKLLLSIFEKNSPLHDGAVIISDGKLLAAKCVLPNSENPNIPGNVGMRHRASIGITENSDAIAIIVSEERGEISYAERGKLSVNLDEVTLKKVIHKAMIMDPKTTLD